MIRTVQRRTRDAFILVLLVPALLGAATLWLEYKNSENLRWVVHTQDVLRSVNSMVSRAYQVESAQRGYLLTGDASFLDNYQQSSRDEWAELRRFGQLTSDNPVQQKNGSRLLAVWRARALLMDRVLQLRKSGPFTPEMADFLRQGRAVMNQMSSIANDMTSEEFQLLRVRRNAQKATQNALVWMFAGGLIMNILLLYWAYQLIRNYGLARDRAEQEILSTNAQLERRVAERTSELQSVNDNLTRSNEDLTRFAYIASHDLQEPLRTVGSYAGLLARRYEGKLDPQADKYIAFIVSGAKRMQTMVQDLLMYSRAGTQQITYSSVDLNALLEVVVQSLRTILTETRAQIEREKLPMMQADEGKLTLVLQNLITNAVKFRHPDRAPLVRITGEERNGEWVITVRDNGIGFDPAYADRIFVIFQRLHQVGEYPGTGIGLAICRRVVEGHGGHIWAASIPGEGSAFSFSIPVHPPARSVLAIPEASEAEAKKG